MKTKLVTVTWSHTVSMELPDNATVQNIDIDSKAKQHVFDMLSANDGEITDIQDDTDEFGGYESEEEMNKGIEAFIADRKAKGLWNQPKQ